MYHDLSSRQIAILNVIKNTIKTIGYPPSVREIGKSVGLSSSSTVHGHLAVLEQKGYLRRNPSKPRAIEVIDGTSPHSTTKELINVPILGKITAGSPILATENFEDVFPIPQDFIHTNNDVFILNVSGDSMIEAGILDGDFVIVEKRTTAQNGEIIVALLGDEATVKRFYKLDDSVKLQPENKFMEPIIVKDVSILGKVIGVFRRIP